MISNHEVTLWQKGVNEFFKNNFVNAMHYFVDVGGYPQICFNIAMIVVMYTKVIETVTLSAVAHFQKGNALFLLKSFKEAILSYFSTIELLHDSELIDYSSLGLNYKLYQCEVLSNIALCYKKTGDLNSYNNYMEKAIRSSITNVQKRIISTTNVKLFFVPYKSIFLVEGYHDKISMDQVKDSHLVSKSNSSSIENMEPSVNIDLKKESGEASNDSFRRFRKSSLPVALKRVNSAVNIPSAKLTDEELPRSKTLDRFVSPKEEPFTNNPSKPDLLPLPNIFNNFDSLVEELLQLKPSSFDTKTGNLNRTSNDKEKLNILVKEFKTSSTLGKSDNSFPGESVTSSPTIANENPSVRDDTEETQTEVSVSEDKPLEAGATYAGELTDLLKTLSNEYSNDLVQDSSPDGSTELSPSITSDSLAVILNEMDVDKNALPTIRTAQLSDPEHLVGSPSSVKLRSPAAPSQQDSPPPLPDMNLLSAIKSKLPDDLVLQTMDTNMNALLPLTTITTNKIKIKIKSNSGRNIIILVDSNLTYKNLVDKIKSKLNLSRNVNLSYVKSNEKMVIDNQSDLDSFLEYHESNVILLN
ncbi:hypothetical protein BC833DRAFT_292930 [Globomyces pollinis-pini]|nr:hypothetical protein BC833DRAFT_292930 [Globomyces pollinis-pini]